MCCVVLWCCCVWCVLCVLCVCHVRVCFCVCVCFLCVFLCVFCLVLVFLCVGFSCGFLFMSFFLFCWIAQNFALFHTFPPQIPLYILSLELPTSWNLPVWGSLGHCGKPRLWGPHEMTQREQNRSKLREGPGENSAKFWASTLRAPPLSHHSSTSHLPPFWDLTFSRFAPHHSGSRPSDWWRPTWAKPLQASPFDDLFRPAPLQAGRLLLRPNVTWANPNCYLGQLQLRPNVTWANFSKAGVM